MPPVLGAFQVISVVLMIKSLEASCSDCSSSAEGETGSGRQVGTCQMTGLTRVGAGTGAQAAHREPGR